MIIDNNWVTGAILPEFIGAAGGLVLLVALCIAVLCWAATGMYGSDSDTKPTFIGLGVMAAVGATTLALSIPFVGPVEGDFYRQLSEQGFSNIKLERGEMTMKAIQDGSVTDCYFLDAGGNDWKIVCE